MLVDDKGIKIRAVSNNLDRKNLYDEVIKKLGNDSNDVMKYIMEEVENYFSHYEEQGRQVHLKAAYIFGGVWDGTPLQKIYDLLLLMNGGNNELAYEQSKEIVGCLMRQVMIDDNLNTYFGQYQGDSGYVYSR